VALLLCPAAGSVDEKVKIVAEAKIPKAADAAKHKAGGGKVEICQLHKQSTLPQQQTRTPHHDAINPYSLHCPNTHLSVVAAALSGPQVGVEG